MAKKVRERRSPCCEAEVSWVGGTWSWGARSSFGVGASTFLAYRDQRASSKSFLQILSTDNRAGVLDRRIGIVYSWLGSVCPSHSW